ncbi:dsRBD fold-containing protein [Streptomyces sp. NPDC057686]|uniref:dsRBD fold-containing protein n=1 Tax=Streptomyces sp. NPDC057686 TaxID=3346212 RepID=UPI0036823CE1
MHGKMINPIKTAVYQDKDFTVVTLLGARYGAIGVAKRHPRDKFNRQTGIDVALARALDNLAEEVRLGL